METKSFGFTFTLQHHIIDSCSHVKTTSHSLILESQIALTSSQPFYLQVAAAEHAVFESFACSLVAGMACATSHDSKCSLQINRN